MPRAARKGDAALCPETGHTTARIEAGDATVLVGGKPAARGGDRVDCRWRGHDSAVEAGDYDVVIGGLAAARIADRTITGGMIAEGCPSVLIEAASFDAVAAAIERIRLTPFGQTEKGKALIERLERMHAKGKIHMLPPNPDEDGKFLPPDDIDVYADEGDVNTIASTLVHEGTHAGDPVDAPPILPGDTAESYKRRAKENKIRREREAWDAEEEYYKQQKSQGAYTYSEGNEDYANTPEGERNGFLRHWYRRDLEAIDKM